jgi:hypothetical protein
MVILDIDMGYELMIWEMTVSIWSSSVSIWDILSLCYRSPRHRLMFTSGIKMRCVTLWRAMGPAARQLSLVMSWDAVHLKHRGSHIRVDDKAGPG